MATIVQFKPTEMPARTALDRAASSCEVILFPGVRYERWPDAVVLPVDEPTPRRKPRARKPVLEGAE